MEIFFFTKFYVLKILFSFGISKVGEKKDYCKGNFFFTKISAFFEKIFAIGIKLGEKKDFF